MGRGEGKTKNELQASPDMSDSRRCDGQTLASDGQKRNPHDLPPLTFVPVLCLASFALTLALGAYGAKRVGSKRGFSSLLVHCRI